MLSPSLQRGSASDSIDGAQDAAITSRAMCGAKDERRVRITLSVVIVVPVVIVEARVDAPCHERLSDGHGDASRSVVMSRGGAALQRACVPVSVRGARAVPAWI